jgi:shikimate dehydrogenase
MKCFGLTGMPVSQSKSPVLFQAAYHGRYSYELLPAATAAEAIHLFREKGLAGMNVTMPLKETILSFIDEPAEEAQLLQAANTVCLFHNKLKAYNTDICGVTGAFTEAKVAVRGKSCIVLGAGGAGRAAACALSRAGGAVVIANRTIDHAVVAAQLLHTKAITLTEGLQNSHRYEIIVNTLPAGVDIVKNLSLKSWQVVLEADYVHRSMQKTCQNTGTMYINGQRWLLHQAIPAYRFFTGEEPDISAMEQALGRFFNLQAK